MTDMLPRLRNLPEVTRRVIISDEIVPSILREAQGHDLIAMGMSGSEEQVLGLVASTVVAMAPVPVMLVRTPEKILLPGVPEATVNVPLSTRVDRWFAENTFHSSEFADLKWMVEAKRALGLTITRWPSVGYASSFTSSGCTKSRPSSSACACVVRISASEPRGDAPRYTDSCSRVAFTSATMYCLISGST